MPLLKVNLFSKLVVLAIQLVFIIYSVSGEEEWIPCKLKSLDVCAVSIIPKCKIVGDKCKPFTCKQIKQKSRCAGVCDWRGSYCTKQSKCPKLLNEEMCKTNNRKCYWDPDNLLCRIKPKGGR